MRTPPPELGRLGLTVDQFKPADDKSFRGPCPRCQGHRRFLIFTDREWPHWNYRCDGCGMSGWADELNAAVRAPISDEQRREWAEARQREEREAQERRNRRVAELTTGQVWQELHYRLTNEHRAWWRAQGVPDDWQDYLQLGYTSDKAYKAADGSLVHSPAYTIPYFHHSTTTPAPQFHTLQYRLFNPPRPDDRYRFEYGLGTTYYETIPTNPLSDQVIICEGAKKAMVTRICGGISDTTVLAVPSKSDFAGVFEAVKDCGRVWICLDPDAEVRARQLADMVGKQARIVTLPVKVDDAFLHHGMTPDDLKRQLRYARPV